MYENLCKLCANFWSELTNIKLEHLPLNQNNPLNIRGLFVTQTFESSNFLETIINIKVWLM